MTGNKLDDLLNKAMAGEKNESPKGKINPYSGDSPKSQPLIKDKEKLNLRQHSAQADPKTIKKKNDKTKKKSKSQWLDQQLEEAEKRLRSESYREAIKISPVEILALALFFYVFHNLFMLNLFYYKLFVGMAIPVTLLAYLKKKKRRKTGTSVSFAGGSTTWFAIFGCVFLGALRYVILVPVIKTGIPQEILWLAGIFCGVLGVGCYYVILETLIYKIDMRFGKK